MELWNECLVNENLTTEIKFQVIVCQGQAGKFDLTLGIVCILTRTIFRNHCRVKKCLLPPVNDWKTSLSRCFNHLELKIFRIFLQSCFEKNERIAIYFRAAKVTAKRRAPDYSEADLGLLQYPRRSALR